ncbi:hypothetical protein HOF78_02045 [Candidatus Woesearchaeota archaeon]|nr:hypothetical protein [Candidatus Woesearchaeota archaeon]
MVLKKRRGASNVTFSTNGRAGNDGILTGVFIALTFLFVFYGSTGGFFDTGSSSFSSITGMAAGGSSNYVDSYSVDMQLRREIRNDVRVLTSNELAGLNSGSISTVLGSTSYTQEIVLGNLMDDETIGNQIIIDYGLSEGLSSDYVGSFLFLESETNPDYNDAFFEYNLEFSSGLKSNYDSGVLENLIGEVIEFVAEEYEIFNVAFDPMANSITLGLIDFIIEDSLGVGEEEFYLLDSKDYVVEVLDIGTSAPKTTTLNISGGNIVDEIVTLKEGETHFLSDGVPIVVKEIEVNETPTSGYVDGNSSVALMGKSYAVAWLDLGYAGFVDTENNAVRVRMLGGEEIVTVAGAADGSAGDVDGVGSDVRFDSPMGIAASKDPNNLETFYVADTGNHKIKKVELIFNSTLGKYDSAEVTTIAGTGQSGGLGPGLYGNDTWFTSPEGIHAVGGGNVYVADTGNNVIRKLEHNGGTSSNEADNWDVDLWAGTTLAGCENGLGSNAKFNSPTDLNYDFTQGFHEAMFVVDSGNHMVRRISNNGSKDVSSFGGECINNSGVAGYVDGVGSNARFDSPHGIVINSITNDIFITDVNNNVIRKIDNDTAEVSTYVGSGVQGYLDGDPEFARFNNPRGIGTVNGNDLLIMDTNNFMFRMLTNGEVVTQFGNLTSGHRINFYIGGEFVEFTDNDYSDDEFNDGGLTLGSVALPETFVMFDVNDTNLSSVVIESMSYRLVPVSESGFDVWLNETFSLSELLDNPSAMIGSFDIVYDGLSNPVIEDVNVVSGSGKDAYNFSFGNNAGQFYNIPLVSNKGSIFKYGTEDKMLVFTEGIINTSVGSTAFDQRFEVGIDDYFILSSLKRDEINSNEVVTHVLRYESIDFVNSVLSFVDMYDGTTVDVSYTATNGGGIAGKGVLSFDNVDYDVYVGNLTNNSLGTNPLAIDQNADGLIMFDETYIVAKGGAIFDLGDHSYSDGGDWDAIYDNSGEWFVYDPALVIFGDNFYLELISSYEEFGYNSTFQKQMARCSISPEISCNGTLPIITETKANITITNDLDYLALVRVEVESCDPLVSMIPNMPKGTTRMFEFENCDSQQLVGRNIEKDVSITYQIGNTGNETNVTHAGNFVSRITGDEEICLAERSSVKVRQISGMKVGISASDSFGSCGFKLHEVPGTEQNYGMTVYGAFFNLTGGGSGSELTISYPLEQVKGSLAFVSGSSESGCTPLTTAEACVNVGLNCGSVSDNCGGTIDCGTCSGNETCGGGGTANVCGSGGCTPLTQAEACDNPGFNCGSVSDGCASTYDCGTCSGNETCSANICETVSCSSDSDCDSGYICVSGSCVQDGGSSSTSFDFDLGNDDYDEFDLTEGDLVIVAGLADDYTFEMTNVYSDGKLKFKIEDSLVDKFYIDNPGDTINIDLDGNDVIDLHVKSVAVDIDDDEATVMFKVGEYTPLTSGPTPAGYCGDGSCNNGETTFTCPSDCSTITRTPTAGSSTGGSSSSTGTSGGYGGAVVIQQENGSSLIWVIIGILAVLVLIVIVITFMKNGSGKKFVKVKSRKPVNPRVNNEAFRRDIGNGNLGW